MFKHLLELNTIYSINVFTKLQYVNNVCKRMMYTLVMKIIL